MEIYLDNAATTKPCPAAVSAMMNALTENWGNPSAVHSRGLLAERVVKNARQQVAAALGCEAGQVFFTSGGTESDNLALIGGALANRLEVENINAELQKRIDAG